MSAEKTTQENLAIAFAGESQANRKYLAFAIQAEKEGYPVIAKLFRAAAEAETVHAMGHLRNMGGVGSTEENLRAAFEGETYEHTQMYPPMVAQAEKEKHKGLGMLRFAEQAEKFHAELYAKAIEAAKAKKDLEDMEIWYCPVCGYIEYGKPGVERCPICNTPREKFVKM